MDQVEAGEVEVDEAGAGAVTDPVEVDQADAEEQDTTSVEETDEGASSDAAEETGE